MSLLPLSRSCKGLWRASGKIEFKRFCAALAYTGSLPSGSGGYSVGVLYIKIGGENLRVLQFLRGYGGKCRSHKMCFWVYGTMVSDAKNILGKSKERFHTVSPWVSYDPTIN